jgi:hypothetical protein
MTKCDGCKFCPSVVGICMKAIVDTDTEKCVNFEPKQQQEDEYPKAYYCDFKEGYCMKREQKQLDVDDLRVFVNNVKSDMKYIADYQESATITLNLIDKMLKGEDDESCNKRH